MPLPLTVFSIASVAYLSAFASTHEPPSPTKCAVDLIEKGSHPWDYEQPQKDILPNRPTLKGERVTLKPITNDDRFFLRDLTKAAGIKDRFGTIDDLAIENSNRFESQTKREYFAAWVIYLDDQRIGYRYALRVQKRLIPQELEDIISSHLANNQIPDFEKGFILFTGGAILPEYQANGFGPESLQIVTKFSKNRLHADMVIATTLNKNAPSKASLEKAGFTLFHTAYATNSIADQNTVEPIDWYSSIEIKLSP